MSDEKTIEALNDSILLLEEIEHGRSVGDEKITEVKEKLIAVLNEIRPDEEEKEMGVLSDRRDPLKKAMIHFKSLQKGVSRVRADDARKQFAENYDGKWISCHRFKFDTPEDMTYFILAWSGGGNDLR